MSAPILATLGRFRKLTPAQRTVLQQKHIQGSYRPDQLIELLRPVADFGAINDGGLSRRGWLIVLLSALAVGLFPLVIYLEISLELSIAALLVLLLSGAKLLVAGKEISTNLRMIALPFLALLREDMRSDAEISVQIDLQKLDSRQHRQAAVPASRMGRRKITTTHYRASWFTGQARLADGSQLRWQVVDDLQVRKSVKHRRRSSEVKIKQSKRSLLQVVVSLPRSNYQLAERAAGDENETKMAVRNTEKWTTIKLSRKLKSTSNEPFDVRELIDLVSAAFRQAVPAQQEEKA